MKRLFSILLVATAIFTLAACGSKSADAGQEAATDLEIKTSEVYGDNAEYISVVPGTYSLKKGNRLTIKVKLKLEKTVEGDIDFVSGPNLRLKDADGVDVVDDFSQMELTDGDRQKMQTFLKQAPGTEQEFVFQNDFGFDKYADVAIEKAKSFSLEGLSISYEEPETEAPAESAGQDEEANAETSANSEEIDQWLADFSDLMDDYVKMASRAQSGELSAADMVTYASLSAKATELASKLDKIKGDLTPQQAARLAEIEAKMASASASLVF